MGRTRVLLLTVAALTAAPAAAQDYPRPALPTGADTLDPRAYWQYSTRPDIDWPRTVEARWWAWRLAPDQTDYLFGVWHALWFRQPPRWRQQFAAGMPAVTRSAPARLLDSLLAAIHARDPFPHLAGPCYLPTAEAQAAAREPAALALVFYDHNCLDQAIDHLGRAIARDPAELWLYLYRARARIIRQQYHDGVADLQVVLDTLRARDAAWFSRDYQSKAFLEYMVGVALLRADDLGGARAAFGRALTEDLSFWPAHARLGDVAAAEGALAEAAAEYALAVGLQPGDGVLQFRYGIVLARNGQCAVAVQAFAAATALEPWWAEPWGQRADCLTRLGLPADAVAAYRAYLARLPARLTRRREEVQRRIASLESSRE